MGLVITGGFEKQAPGHLNITCPIGAQCTVHCSTDSTCRYMYYLWSVVDHNKTTKAYSSCPLAKEQNLLVIGLGLPSLRLAYMYFYSGKFMQTSQKLRKEPQKEGRKKLLPAMICHVSVLNFHILEISHTTVV